MPPMLETWMMCPAPWARMIGKAAWVIQRAPKTFVSSWARISGSVSSSIVPKCP
jgi:hypothetical protein